MAAAAGLAAAGRLAPAVADDGSMNYMRSFGPAADPVLRLNWGLMTISIAVCVIISALVLLAIFRKRPPLQADADGRLPVGPARGGMAWLYVGVGISTVVLFGSAIWTILTLSAVAVPRSAATLTLEVTGHQWWWEVKYLSDVPTQAFTTANEIHIPVGEPIRIRLVGGDVIHSFWIPQLVGKTDMIPGQSNTTWLQADKAGSYRGQCGEYCGVQHAHMAMHVIAEDKARFEAWRREQLADADRAESAAMVAAPPAPAVPQSPDGAEPPALAASADLHGSDVFMTRCSACHAVRGTPARGRLGPDLTHVMSRRMIASGMLVNNTGNLSGWVANAQALKPGSRMPAMDLTPQELHAVVRYLQTLH
jgi:cytochrome c oxidase subunit 2